jgi:hypothetical protein
MTFPLTLVFILLVFWRPQEWLFPVMFGWPVLNIITGMAVVGLIMDSGQGAVRFPKTPAVWLAAGLFFAAVMSQVVNTYFQGMLDTMNMAFKLCFFLILLLVVLNSIRRMQWVLFVMVLGAIIMATHSVLQDVTGVGFAGCKPIVAYYSFKDRWISQSQFFGIFSDPNDLGQFLATCIPLIFAIPKRMGFRVVVVGGAIAFLLGWGMLATDSRGTLIGVAASLGCIVLLVLPVKWLPYLAALMLIAGLGLCTTGVGFMDESAQNRITFWGDGNRYFKHHFLFGGGFGMFDDFSGALCSAHNAYVTCYSELGFFGYWFWFNTLTLGLIGCWRTRLAFKKAKTPEQAHLKRMAGLCIAAMAGFASSSYFLSRAYVFPMFFLFGILNSVPLIAARYLPEDHPPLLDDRKDVFFAGTVMSLLSIVYIYFTIVLLNHAVGS